MFLNIDGNLVNTDHIVQVTKENHVQLSSGNVISASPEEADYIRGRIHQMNDNETYPVYSYAPRREPKMLTPENFLEVPAEYPADQQTAPALFQGMTDRQIIEKLSKPEAEVLQGDAEKHAAIETPAQAAAVPETPAVPEDPKE